MEILDPRAFADWVKQHREGMGLTQEELAGKAGITRSTVIRLEKGETSPSRKTAENLALVMGRPVGEALRLAGYNGDPVPPMSREEREVLSALRSVPQARRSEFVGLTKAHAQILSGA